MRQDILHALRRLVRVELAALRQLARDRRVASARLPELLRTGPGAAGRKEPVR